MPAAGKYILEVVLLWAQSAVGLTACALTVACGSELVEDTGETCSSGVSWTGIAIPAEFETVSVTACVESICVQRLLPVESGDNCGVKIEGHGSVVSSACAFGKDGIAHLVFRLDLSRVATDLRQGDKSRIEVSSQDGDILLQYMSELSYVGSTNGKTPCRTAEVLIDADSGN